MQEDLTRIAKERYGKSVMVKKNYLDKLYYISDLVGNGGRVLDLGSGSGLLATLMMRNNNVTTVDLHNADFVVDLQREPLPFAESFNTVTCIELIEHIWAVDRLLKDIYRVLQKDGKLIISTPNLASLGRRLLMLCGVNPYVENFLRPQEAGHVKHYTLKEFKYILEENEFIVDNIVGDCVMFSNSGEVYSNALGKMFPKLSRSLIAVCRKS